MTDLISQATRMALNTGVNYNPGLPLTVDFRPLTLSPKLGDPISTPPGTNIYKGVVKHRTNGALSSDSITAQVKSRILGGGRGNHSDYTGLILLAFYSQDPDDWHSLFHVSHMQIPYSRLLFHATGLSERHCVAFINGSDSLFKGKLDPLTHEEVLRSLLNY